MFFETRKSLIKFIPDKKLFFIPDWVGAEVDLSQNLSLLIKRSSSVKYIANKIKKNKLKYSISNKNDDLNYFYNKMYTPYIRNRHQNKAFIKKYSEIEKAFHKGELLFIRKEQNIVAGVIINYDQPNGAPRLTQLGVLDGNYDYVKDGVISALYFCAMEYIRDKGFSTLNFGWSRPFLNDGVLNYKKKWRCSFGLESDRMFILLPLTLNHISKEFLINNPFMSIRQNRLVGNIFVDGSAQSKKIDLEKLRKRYRMNGVSSVHMHDLSNDVLKTNKWLIG